MAELGWLGILILILFLPIAARDPSAIVSLLEVLLYGISKRMRSRTPASEPKITSKPKPGWKAV